jgi:cytoskeleton protein RodZ
VHADFLQALEEDRYEVFPARTYAVGFLRSCARSLGLDEEELLRRYHAEIGETREEEEQLWGDEPEEPKGRWGRRVVLLIAAALIAASAVAYLVLSRLQR